MVFLPRLPKHAHVARLTACDVFVDNFIYGAHTTGSDALWAAVPLLSMQGGLGNAHTALALNRHADAGMDADSDADADSDSFSGGDGEHRRSPPQSKRTKRRQRQVAAAPDAPPSIPYGRMQSRVGASLLRAVSSEEGRLDR